MLCSGGIKSTINDSSNDTSRYQQDQMDGDVNDEDNHEMLSLSGQQELNPHRSVFSRIYHYMLNCCKNKFSGAERHFNQNIKSTL